MCMRMNIRKQMENVHTQIGNVYLSCAMETAAVVIDWCNCRATVFFFVSSFHCMDCAIVISFGCITIIFAFVCHLNHCLRFFENMLSIYIWEAPKISIQIEIQIKFDPNPPFGLMMPTFHRIFVHIFQTYAIYYIACACVFVYVVVIVWCASV